MGAEVWFWWLVTLAGPYSSTSVLPIPYQTQEMCQWAIDESGIDARCIPQPAADVAEYAATQAMGKPDVCELDDGLTKR